MNLKEQMDLLSIKDVSTPRQTKNGTVVWRLPIKNNNSGKTFIEVASFKTGYVRNQNSGYSNYQLNKRCESEPEYYQLANGDYRKYTTRTCKLIPNEKARLEYLIAYCLKNYFIKNANQVAEGSYVSKWYHEYELERQDTQNEHIHYDRIQDLEVEVELLQEQLEHMTKARDYYKASNTFNDSMYEGRNDEVKNLENKLATIERIANDRNKWNG